MSRKELGYRPDKSLMSDTLTFGRPDAKIFQFAWGVFFG